MSAGGHRAPWPDVAASHDWTGVYTRSAALRPVAAAGIEWRIDLGELRRIERVVVYAGQHASHDSVTFEIAGSFDGEAYVGLHTGMFSEVATPSLYAHIFQPRVMARFLSIRADTTLIIERVDVAGSPIQDSDAAARAMPPTLSGVADLVFNTVTDTAGFGFGDTHERIEIFPTLAPPPQLPLQMTVAPPPILAAEHHMYANPPPVCAYAVHGAALWGYGLLTVNNQFVWLDDCMPGYFRGHIRADGHDFENPIIEPDRWHAARRIVVDRPVASPIHPNMVYGHFLLEILPKFYVLATMKQLGIRFAVALPRNILGWIRPFVDLYFAEADLIWYDLDSEIVEAPAFIHSSMMHTQYNFNAAFNLLITDLRARAGLPIAATAREPEAPRFIYISRSQIEYHKRLHNETEIEALMQALGFTVVHPQSMSLRDQLRLFGDAEIVVGEYSSALHNTLFAPIGTRVVSIDFFSWYQSAIGRLRQQPITFIAPDDGIFRHWRQTAPHERSYSVDLEVLRDVVSGLM